MPTGNQKGQVTLFFALVIPILVLSFVVTVEFAKLVHTKIKLQGALDRAAYAGTSYLTEVLNQIALLNWEAHQKFVRLKKALETISKPNEETAKAKIKNLWLEQDRLREEMEGLSRHAYAKAHQIADQVVHNDFPEAKLLPLYFSPLVFKDGTLVNVSYDKVQGRFLFDPTGHQKIPKSGWKARMGFVKETENIAAFASGAELAPQAPLLHILKSDIPLRAVAAGKPYGGSIWDFALSSKDESHLYRAEKIPLEVLPAQGLIPLKEKYWRDFDPYERQY